MSKAAKDRIEESQRVKNALELAGYRLTDIDRKFGLPRGSAGDALRNPNEAAEKAIAAVLQKKASDLWPSRHDPNTGVRLSPQPHENYARPPAIRQRRKGDVSSTEEALT